MIHFASKEMKRALVEREAMAAVHICQSAVGGVSFAV